jgi:hypothetical protein
LSVIGRDEQQVKGEKMERTNFESLQVYQLAERLADEIFALYWQHPRKHH